MWKFICLVALLFGVVIESHGQCQPEHAHQWPMAARPVKIYLIDNCGFDWEDKYFIGPGNRMNFSKHFKLSICTKRDGINSCVIAKSNTLKQGDEVLVLYCDKCMTAISMTIQK